MNVERQERTRPETRDQSSCSPCAVNALCSISLVVWHYFWRPRRRRVAVCCMTRRDWVRSYSGDSTSKHTEIFCVCFCLWLFLFWLFLMRPMVYFQLEGTGWQWLTNWEVRCFNSECVQERLCITRKGKGPGICFGKHSRKDWQCIDKAYIIFKKLSKNT